MSGLREELAHMVWAVVIAMVGGVVFLIGKANEPEPGPFGLTDLDHWSYTVEAVGQLLWVVAFLAALIALVRIALALGRTGRGGQAEAGDESRDDGGIEPA